MRYTTLGSDATITRSGFIETTKRAVVTSTKALQLARRKHEPDSIKYRETLARDARRITKLKRRTRIVAKREQEFYNGGMRSFAALAERDEEGFLGSVRSLRYRRAVVRMRTILRRKILSVQYWSTGSHILTWQQNLSNLRKR